MDAQPPAHRVVCVHGSWQAAAADLRPQRALAHRHPRAPGCPAPGPAQPRHRAPMDPHLRALKAAQGGVFTRRQAVECGYTERQLKTLTRPGGHWTVLRRGVYAETELVEALSDDDRYLLGVHAVAVSTWKTAVISHTSAAAVHGLPLRPHWYALHHVTRPDVLGGRTDNGVTHHRAQLRDVDVVLAAGLRVTSPARTAVDIARLHGFTDGVVAADAALRAGARR